ncbi:MAG: hypothetical protein Q4B50_06200 [Bacillota bacterium]|nr:hypothetical protein [Bacillota bacterium]
MELGISIPLEKFLKMPRSPYGIEETPCFCWELNCIMLLGRKSLLAMNCQSHYALVLYDLPAETGDSLPELFLEGMKQSMLSAGFSKKHLRIFGSGGGPPPQQNTRTQYGSLSQCRSRFFSLFGILYVPGSKGTGDSGQLCKQSPRLLPQVSALPERTGANEKNPVPPKNSFLPACGQRKEQRRAKTQAKPAGQKRREGQTSALSSFHYTHKCFRSRPALPSLFLFAA